jgi:MSHA biogenesis protein MshQ
VYQGIPRPAFFLALAFGILLAPVVRAQVTYNGTMLSDSPLGFWTLASNNATDLANGYSSTYVNGATTSPPGTGVPLAGSPVNTAVSLDGNNTTPQYVTTGLSGGIGGTGSIVAWVNLSALPSSAGAFFYVAGESQSGNDFDVQFQTDNALYFYTGAGENTSYTPNPAALVGQWNQIVVTYAGGSSGFRDIYWDGNLVSNFNGSVNSASKTSAFTIGYSSVFGGRDFNGLIDDVAVLGTVLSPLQVAQLYAMTPVPEPSTYALMALGIAGLAVFQAGRAPRKVIQRLS